MKTKSNRHHDSVKYMQRQNANRAQSVAQSYKYNPERGGHIEVARLMRQGISRKVAESYVRHAQKKSTQRNGNSG